MNVLKTREKFPGGPASTAGGTGSIPGWGTKILPHGTVKNKRKNLGIHFKNP